MQGSYLGPKFRKIEIEKELNLLMQIIKNIEIISNGYLLKN